MFMIDIFTPFIAFLITFYQTPQDMHFRIIKIKYKILSVIILNAAYFYFYHDFPHQKPV